MIAEVPTLRGKPELRARIGRMLDLAQEVFPSAPLIEFVGLTWQSEPIVCVWNDDGLGTLYIQSEIE